MNFKNAVCGGNLLLLLLCIPSQAGFQVFSQRAVFEAAYLSAGGISEEIGFDDMPPTVLNDGDTINGVSFSSGIPGIALKVATGAATTSGLNFLGTEDADIFQNGDSFLMNFSERIGIGLYVISADPLFDGDIVLSFGGQDAMLVAADVEDDLGPGGQVWFLGILSDVAFTSATLTSPGPPSYFFNADNVITIVATPEPSTMVLFPTLAAVGWGYRRWRGKSRPVLKS